MTRWQLHTGEALDWLLGQPDESADALIVDPPYASGGRTASMRKKRPLSKYLRASSKVYPDFAGDCRDQRSWVLWMTPWLQRCWRVLRTGAPACVFADWRQLPATTDAFQAAGFIWRGTAVWNKTGASRPVRGRFRNQCEYIVWGSKGGMCVMRQCHSETNVLPGMFTHRVEPRSKHHVTGKPVPLMCDLVRICEPGGLIIDPMAGSGSTGVAALQLGYRFHGCELLEEYADIARQRLAEALVIDRRERKDKQLTLGRQS